ncbi:class I SAM-dependent methyltransferase [Nonomuraea muscovyensis]|uniref:Ubiquinone/menaquinone biosynthesis C-methylase UbiE n=1 Tax=Nonomuraea muscovyensis TaxID=1124761 RepID=A0A7X0C9T7_9ACTN|nr:methyltransferase domain-containing protein [Nonomuraea muscovyensis]MBB6350947.1 ubiquinone/menaquinone biosynthesis C-methylase UbiE [Nonomuraea muscovyensis]MDF2710443.1 methyltransferase protein [Nonomuraea muscovyensis]
MGLGKLLHDHARQGHAEGTINHPRAYDVLASIGFAGRRREVFTRLAALSGARPGDRALDVGCGTGYLTRVLAPLIGSAGRVVGVDPSPSMVEYARRRAPENCSYVVGEGQALDLPDRSFDVVVTSLAVHHMPEAERGAAVREMFRVLRPGGRLLVAEFRRPANRLLAGLLSLVGGAAHRHSPRDLLGELIPRAGFHVEGEGDLPPLLFYVRAVRPRA